LVMGQMASWHDWFELKNDRTSWRSVPTTEAARGRSEGLVIGWPGLGELRRYGDVSNSTTSAVPDRSEIGPYV
jgi:hypothetical protein